ncbi:MAG: tetratricopeptide repeat protein, partial [Schwartzia sp.]|nr:tetratricopeptide repeat protein [Schwartzia sp. (in: firmicutes)]
MNDGIADDALRDKFHKLLSSLEAVPLRDSELRCYLLAALFAIKDRDYERAAECFRHYELKCFGTSLLQSRPFLYYYKALISYGLMQYRTAAEDFFAYFQYDGTRDEVACFHLGNCFFRLQQWEQALDAYRKALAIRKDFREAMINIGLVA